MTPACTISVMGNPIRLYLHPTVQHGMLWSTLDDIAVLVGYPPDMASQVADVWRRNWPDYSRVAEDGSVVVPETAAHGFLLWLITEDVPAAAAIKAEYERLQNAAYLALTADVPLQQFREALRASSLADALPSLPPEAAGLAPSTRYN
jgi:hypothetical protein